ncbi:hypothetical protein DFP72DRAFT_771136, partial [Ephemerocybe angulata]
LLFIGAGNIAPGDLIHRDKLADLILRRFILECDRLQDEFNNCESRISITSDMWSAKGLTPFMAVTAHYM